MGKNESKDQTSKISTAGRIGRRAKIIEQETDRDILEKVMQGAEQFKSFNYAQKAVCGAQPCEFIIHLRR